MEELLALILKAFVPILVTGLVGAITLLWKRIKALQLALTAMMRDRLVNGLKYWLEREYLPLEERTSFEKMYEAYHINGGNGVVTDLYERAMALPYSLHVETEE